MMVVDSPQHPVPMQGIRGPLLVWMPMDHVGKLDGWLQVESDHTTNYQFGLSALSLQKGRDARLLKNKSSEC